MFGVAAEPVMLAKVVGKIGAEAGVLAGLSNKVRCA